MSSERVYVYWDRPGLPPKVGARIHLQGGRTGVVDTAKPDDHGVPRKLTVIVDPKGRS